MFLVKFPVKAIFDDYSVQLVLRKLINLFHDTELQAKLKLIFRSTLKIEAPHISIFKSLFASRKSVLHSVGLRRMFDACLQAGSQEVRKGDSSRQKGAQFPEQLLPKSTRALLAGGCRERNCLTCIVMMESDLKSHEQRVPIHLCVTNSWALVR